MSKEKNPEQISFNIFMKQKKKKPLNFFVYKNNAETVKSEALPPLLKELIVFGKIGSILLKKMNINKEVISCTKRNAF